MKLRIRNWNLFQHYKDRRPKWIKLHFQTLSSRDWVSASNSERVLAVACMLVASQSEESDASFEADPDYFKRVAYLHEKPDFNPLIQRGFLEVVGDASKPYEMLANDTQSVSVSSLYISKDSSLEDKPSVKQKALSDTFGENFTIFWSAYPKKVDKQEAKKAWSKMVGIDMHVLEVVSGIDKWKSSGCWDDPQYIPNPATFLRHERWKDEVPARKAAVKPGDDSAERIWATFERH